MKTLTLASLEPKNDTVSLEVYRGRKCNFCGEVVDEKTVEGVVKLSLDVPKIRPKEVITDWKTCFPLLGRVYKKAMTTEYVQLKIDICFSCIRQLAELIPKV
jgi:hypothetical protein